MRKMFSGVVSCALAGVASAAAAGAIITITHELDSARAAEIVSIPIADIAAAMPEARMYHLVVRDSKGKTLPSQITNYEHDHRGVKYDDLVFAYNFKAGEKRATFTLENLPAATPPEPACVYARFVPERLDDFAWENDKIAHRTYGPALAAPVPPGASKEVLVTSGLDVWCKRVAYPIVDRWYNKGHDHYHKDEGEGMDMYQVGPSRGCGGTGIWDGQQLHVSRNYQSWRVLANGPIRAIFELTYDTWMANGVIVSEVKRFTVDAGHNLDRIESTFTVAVGAKELTVAIGLNRNPADKGQEPKITVTPNAADGSFTQWVEQKSNGALGTAIIVPEGFAGFAEDERNHLLLAKAVSGVPLRYYAGAGWSKAGEFTSRESWNANVAAFAARLRSPLKITLTP